ncbi:transcription initiation factor TFIIF subunit beta [Nematocida minor]|uniref:transcription initiation factor TFIIF subunit beta n=1 Tax=Nematocida minor TaxID=1912983 RepID=UPI00221FF77A|nr:transcription initiation factor TFIIF subunit beta [Nematocida minor]KAI5192462.1 transcription initiation factor TFIIF subunit beta [Nematocida minor]
MGERRHTRVTLVKAPRILEEYLEEYGEAVEIGVIEEVGESNVLKISAQFGPQNFPREWILAPLEEKTGMFTFVQKPHGAFIDGVVTDEVYIKPKITPEYLKYKKERAAVLNVKKDVKAVDSLKDGIRMERYGATEHDVMARKRKKMLMEKKRERLDQSEVMDILFRAFEEYPYWSVKDLADRSGQPQAYILELLANIATLNKKTHRNMYELKPEYKNNN